MKTTRKIKNPTELGGMLGENVSVKKKGKKVVVTNRPSEKEIPLSEGQLAANEKFQEAAKYASQQIKNPSMKSKYETGINEQNRTAFLVALSDYLVAPKVRQINALEYTGNAGDSIVVHAKDDFMVTSVKVTITGSDGSVIEKGDAVQDPIKFIQWKYTATVANLSLVGTTIKAVAEDNAGNLGRAEKSL
jgi:hypothetical protein